MTLRYQPAISMYHDFIVSEYRFPTGDLVQVAGIEPTMPKGAADLQSARLPLAQHLHTGGKWGIETLCHR